MKILTGFLQPTEGTAKVDGIDVLDDRLAVQSKIGYLPENAPIYEDMAVQEYLLMAAELRDVPEAEQIRGISEAVWATGLDQHLTRPIGDLSKGYRQRVGLAQAIMHKPKLLILDEPTNGLDPTQIAGVRELIKRLAQSATVIVSTHILAEVEATCDRAIIIMNGRIRADAKLDELTSSSSAVVKVDKSANEVVPVLGTLDGVDRVVEEAPANGFNCFRVIGAKDLDLCPMIFDTAVKNGWRLGELKPEVRTLESVFRELAENEGVAA